MNLLRIAYVSLGILFLTSKMTFAQTLWTAGVGDWSDSGNWTLGAPGAINDAQINNGGTAQVLGPGALAFNVSLGTAPISSGTLDVQGGQAQFTSVLAVGAFGHGELNITGGGQVSNIHGRIGRELGGSGSVTVAGPGSLWHNSGDLTVGSTSGGVGALAVEDQATVYVQNNLGVSNASTVNLSGGTLRFNTIDNPSRLNYTSGTIQLAGDRTIRNTLSIPPLFNLFGSSPVIPSGKGLTVEGSALIYESTLAVSGGVFTSEGTLRVGISGFAGGSLLIDNGGTVLAGADVNIEIANPSVSGVGSLLSVAGSLDIKSFVSGNRLSISDGAKVHIANTLFIRPDSSLFFYGGTLRFNDYSNAGSINYTGGTVQLGGDRTLGSDSAITDFFGATVNLTPGKSLVVEGTAILPATSPLTLSGGGFTADTVLMTPGSRITNTTAALVSGSVLVSTGAIIDATAADLAMGDPNKVDGFYSNGRLLVGQRIVSLADANDAVFDSAARTTLGSGGIPGTLVAVNGLTLDFGGNVTGFGTIDTPNDPAKPLTNNGHITGNSLAEPVQLAGYVKGVGTYDNVEFAGTFAPGFSPAQVNLGSANYSGTLEIEIGGLVPGSSGYDQLNHILGEGIAQLGGELQVSLLNGFEPQAGYTFTVMTALGGVAGNFADVSLPSLGGGLSWSLLYEPNAVLLAVIDGIPGDFDFDGDVDGRDFLVWQRNTSVGNLADWQNNYGAGILVAESVAVPEPRSLMLISIGMIAFGRRATRFPI